MGPLGHLDDYLIPRLARRIRTATTLNGASDAYLEHGQHVVTTGTP